MDGQSITNRVDATYRSLYQKDVTDPALSSELKQLIAYMDAFQNIYYRVSKYTNRALAILTLGQMPKLFPAPPKVSETTTFESEDRPIEPEDYAVRITSGNVYLSGKNFRTRSEEDEYFTVVVQDKTTGVKSKEYTGLMKKLPKEISFENFSKGFYYDADHESNRNIVRIRLILPENLDFSVTRATLRYQTSYFGSDTEYRVNARSINKTDDGFFIYYDTSLNDELHANRRVTYYTALIILKWTYEGGTMDFAFWRTNRYTSFYGHGGLFIIDPDKYIN